MRIESFDLNARIYGLELDAMQRTIREMSELLRVQDKLNVSVRELSLGERAKMELIASLLQLAVRWRTIWQCRLR